jgi:hypothetical protein
VEAVRADDLDHVQEALARRDVIPVHVHPLRPLLSMLGLRPLLSMLGHGALVDARMRKAQGAGGPDRSRGPDHRLGPSLVAGRQAHIVIETS